jgi:hypothetical protein
MNIFLRMLRNLYIEFQWDTFVSLGVKARDLELATHHRHPRSPEHEVLWTQAEVIRSRMARIARSIGLSETAAYLPVRPAHGRLPRVPEWLLVK